MTDLQVRPVWRSAKYRKWLREQVTWCQHCHAVGPLEIAHPPRRRPWGGGTGLKASDYGCLMLCHQHNQQESDAPAAVWLDPRERDRIVLRNLIAYVSYLDPGVDLEAEMMERVQERIAELERSE